MRTSKGKPCKRKNCPFYSEITKKCQSCDWNPNSVWTEKKSKS